MNAEYIQSKIEDYLSLQKALNHLEIQINSAFAYQNPSKTFSSTGDQIKDNLKVFSDKVLREYAQFIREALDDELA